MTEINGLRLAYRGLVAGLAAGYVWLAVGLLLALPSGDPLSAHQALAASLLPMQPTREGLLLLALGGAEVAGGAFGMLFAYFIGRFFTVRPTLALAAPSLAVLAWLLLASGSASGVAAHAPLLVAAAIYGLVLGQCLPLRGEVERYPAGSPST